MNTVLDAAEEKGRGVHIGRALALVWRSAPLWTVVNALLAAVQGVLPLAGIYVLKRVVDAVTAGFGAADKAAAFHVVLYWVIAAGAVALAALLARTLAELAAEAQAQAVTDHISDLLHAQSVAVDLEFYEDARFHDTLHRAQQDAPFRPSRIVNGLVQFGQNGLALVGVAGLLSAFNWRLALIIFAVAIPGALVRTLYARRLFGFERRQTENERRAWYYHLLLTDSASAKEIRLFDLGRLFRERFRGLRARLREERISLARRRTFADFAAQTLAAGAIFCALGFIAYQAVLGTVTVGSLVMYYTAFQAGVGFLQGVLRGVTGLYEDNLFLANLYRFLALKPALRPPLRPHPIPDRIQSGVVFENVSFHYAADAREVLSGVNLTIEPGRVIALVGENGSGKTTLVKLLCRLYDPTGGRITLDGVDLDRFDPVRWRRELSVMFQDYLQYNLTVGENIWLGDAGREPDRDRIVRAGRSSGAEAVVGRLPAGYDTQLGHWFRGGHQLSVGEWQKIALARAFFRDARLVVLDEPTSSLDPLAEADLFFQFRKFIEGRSAILISHRFSTVHMADYIYVLDRGTIAEHGTHQELLGRAGRYARLFRAQAEHYQPPRTS